MSSLDRAFIKAYKRSPAGAPPVQSYESAQPLVDPLANPYDDQTQVPSPNLQDAWSGAGLRYRFDGPHLAADSAVPHAHTYLSPQAYTDLGYGHPYFAVPPHPSAAGSGPHFATVPPMTLPDHEPSFEPEIADTRVPVARQAEPPVPASEDTVPTSGVAGRLQQPEQLPPPLELPTIFRGEDRDTSAAGETAKAFAPDWEVDHFVWPRICEQLLEAEATYFRHVGERLREATAKYPHVLMIAGCRRGEGRTTLALCLARCAAQAGVKVALLDADLKNPQLGARLGMEIPCGWSEVLCGKAPLHEAAVASVADQLTLFPLLDTETVDVKPGDAGLISLVREISEHYPLVVVDIGPLGAEDRHPFAGEDACPVNAAIVVRDLRFTTEKKAHVTAQHLERSGIPAVGIAENFVETI